MQRRENIHGLSHLPDHESFDAEFSPSGLILQLITRKSSGAVHRVERYLRDSDEQAYSILTLDSADSEIEATEFIRESEERRVWTTRDSSGRVVANGIDEHESGLFTRITSFRQQALSTQKSIEYMDGKPMRRISNFYGRPGELAERWITRFDGHARIIETYGLKADGSPLGDGR